MKYLIFTIAIVTSLDLFSQKIEIQNDLLVLKPTNFGIFQKSKELVKVQTLIYPGSEFKVLYETFGEPIEIIEKEDMIQHTKEFVFEEIKIKFTSHQYRWELESIDMTGDYGFNLGDKSSTMRNLRSGIALRSVLEESSSPIALSSKEIIIHMYNLDSNGNLIPEKSGGYSIARDNSMKIDLDANGTIKNIFYFRNTY